MTYIFTVQSYKVFNFPPITILCYSLYLNCGIFVRLRDAKVAKKLIEYKRGSKIINILTENNKTASKMLL